MFFGLAGTYEDGHAILLNSAAEPLRQACCVHRATSDEHQHVPPNLDAIIGRVVDTAWQAVSVNKV